VSESLFGEDPGLSAADEALIGVYELSGRTLDDLPYTKEFDVICASLDRTGGERAVLQRLMNLRKAGKLPRMGRAQTLAVRLTDEEEGVLRELLREQLGTTGARDTLPYTPGFDALHSSFSLRTGRELERHTLWRLVCKLAK
jgi:hypothetical protein